MYLRTLIVYLICFFYVKLTPVPPTTRNVEMENSVYGKASCVRRNGFIFLNVTMDPTRIKTTVLVCDLKYRVVINTYMIISVCT